MKKKSKDKRKKVIIGIFLVIFLVSSIGGYFVFNDSNDQGNTITLDLPSGKYRFERAQDTYGNLYYKVNSDKGEFVSYYLPDQVRYGEEVRSIAGMPMLYVAFDPRDENLNVIDFLRYDVKRFSGKTILDGITANDTDYDFPVVDCQVSDVPIIVLRQANTTSIAEDNSCISINFTQSDILQVRDMLVYSLRGIETG